MLEKRGRLNYKQYKHHFYEDGDMTLNTMHIEEHFPMAADILTSKIVKFITISENSCGYSGTTEELIVN